jgi:RNA polymerase sigma-70 factor (ECF subfamily)
MPTRGTAQREDIAIRAPYSDADWVARIRESDHAAFEALVRWYSDRLCAFIYRSTRDVEATKELVQDLFLWIWRHRHEWDVRGGLTTYLYRSARNRAISYLRHHDLEQRWRAEAMLVDAGDASRISPNDGAEQVGADDLAAAIDRAVSSLPDRCQQVFTLNRQHRLSYREIAETLGISVKTVEVHMGRALAAMRRHLTDWI